MDMLDNLNSAGKTILMVTHEEDIAHRAKRIIRMRDGHVVSDTQNGRAKSSAVLSPVTSN
jgi:putative ABC transport system ATP-binding protein